MELILIIMNIVFCGAVIVFTWRYLDWIWLKPKKTERYLRKQGLNGTPYKFLYGDLKDMAQMAAHATSKPINLTDDIIPRVVSFLHNAAKTHGKMFFTWMGPRPVLHITDPLLLREIFGDYNRFQLQRGANPLTKLIGTGVGDAEGDEWVKHRKILNPAFHVEKLKHMVSAFYVSCNEMINKWEEITKGGSCEVDVLPYLHTFTSDVISRTAFGSSYEEGRRIFELQQEQCSLVLKAVQVVYIPGSRFLPTKSKRRMLEIDREIKRSITNIIHKWEAATKAGENSEDLLGMLMESNYKEIKQQGNKSSGLTINDVIENCKVFYFAGQETTANLLAWTMILLSQHTNWQNRARDEVFTIFGKGKPDIHGINRLKVVNMIFQEVLRLYTPGISPVRMVHEETKIGDITVPAGTYLRLHLLLMHHDRDIWGDDVKEFNPERFAEGVSMATKGQPVYMPFGGGPRICIGNNFAMLEVKLALSMILQRFSFQLSPSYAHAPQYTITLQPQFGAQLILSEL